ncbi:melatonin receptor type 1B-like [Saccoglossus kowalevskii]|uniref:Melatonin receptor type 1C-like n=1 Tax=Saccoglossus kowalevskii TaxID=10224 RepID=A0ABM0MRY2_SACKO|nr:PREDICTED: melatonin receptor type 1C-like [Saccoglossus kowalevskii]
MNKTTVTEFASIQPVARWVSQLAGSVEVLFAVLTLLGNISFIVVVLATKRLRKKSNAFLISLSVCDLCSALFVSSVTADAFIRREWRLGTRYCIAHNMLYPILSVVSLWITASISLNRYISIVHHERSPKLTTKLTITLAIIFSWILPMILIGRNFIVPGASVYSPISLRCLPTRKTTFSMIILIIIPIITVITSYIVIFIYVYQSRRRVQQQQRHNQAWTNNQLSQQVLTKKEFHVLATVFAVFLFILAEYIPFSILVNLYGKHGRFPEVMMLSYPLNHIGGVINPVLYVLLNKTIRDAFKQLIKWVTRQHSTTDHVLNI